MGSLVIGSCNYKSQVKAKAESRITFHHQHVPETSTWTDEGSSFSVSSNHGTQMSSQANFSEEELFVIQHLNERLTYLEEETQMIKQEFCQSILERKQLMNEIYQRFQIIRCTDQVTPDQFSKVTRRRPGLLQVLCQDDSNLPSIIIRDLKAKAVKSSITRR